jgi:hypothetical protein
VTLLVLAALGGAAAAVYWFVIRIPPGRLIVWQPEGSPLPIKVEGDAALGPDGIYRVADGACTVSAGDGAESARFQIKAGTVNLCVIGGAPVEAVATLNGRILRLRGRFPPPGPLHACLACGELEIAAVCPRCSKPTDRLPPDAELVVSKSERFVDPATDTPLLLIANPYASSIRMRLSGPGLETTFDLAPGRVRALPCKARDRIRALAHVEPGGRLLDESEIEAPEGVSICAVGGATWFQWMGGDGEREADGSLVPAPVQRLALKAGEMLALPKPDDAAVLAKETGERLVTIVSAPLLPRESRPAGRVTVHPKAKVHPLQTSKELDGKAVEAAASTGRGAIAIFDGVLYDLATGESLQEAGGPRFRSAAVSSQGLVLVTRQGRLATLDGRKPAFGMTFPDPTIRVWADPAGPEVFLYGGKAIRGLYLLGEEGPVEILPDYPPVTALGSTPEGTLVARGRRIDLLPRGGRADSLRAVLALPDGPDIVGVHDAGRGLVFATAAGAHWLSDNVAVPLALGIGGELFGCEDGIVVHDRAGRRLHLLKGPFLRD